MSFYHIRSREGPKYEAVIHCSVLVYPFCNRANAGGCQGAVIAELDEPGNEPNFDLFLFMNTLTNKIEANCKITIFFLVE